MSKASDHTRVNQFNDIKAAFDVALATNVADGEVCGSITLPTYGAAVNWRMRAYNFRKLWRTYRDPNSPYDSLTLPKLPEKSSVDPSKPCPVVIRRCGVAGVVFQPVTGAFVPKEDELQKTANEVAKRLNLEDL